MSKRGNHGGKAEHREKKLAIKSDVKNVQKSKLKVETPRQYRLSVYIFNELTKEIRETAIFKTKNITKARAYELAKNEAKGYYACYSVEAL